MGAIFVIGALGQIVTLVLDVSGQSTVSEAVSFRTTIYVSPLGSDTNAGTLSDPVRSIQRGVELANQANSADRDGLVSVASGVYREAVTIGSVSTTKTLTIRGAGVRTVLTGADDWSSGWIPQADGSFVHSWPYKWGMKAIPPGWDDYWNWDGNGHKRDILRRSEMVYVNGFPLRGVLRARELSEVETFYVDEANGKLWMRLPAGISLAGSLIEVGIRTTPLTIAGRNSVTLRDFAVMRNRGAVQDAAVAISNLRNQTLDNVTVQWVAATGLATAAISQLHIANSMFADNGIYGHSDWRAQGALVDNVELARNNWRGWRAEHKGFDTVHKWTESRDVTIRRSRFIDNLGHGVWFDGDNQRATIEDNLIARNGTSGVGNGIYLELNNGPITIRRNRICDNAQGGIADGRSNDVRVLENEIWSNRYYQLAFSGSDMPLRITDWLTGDSYMAESSKWVISGNKIKGGPLAGGEIPKECYPGPCGWIIWTPDANHYAYIARTLTADRNQYFHTATAKAFRVPDSNGQALTFATWRRAISTVLENEVHSTFGDPGALSCTPTP